MFAVIGQSKVAFGAALQSPVFHPPALAGESLEIHLQRNEIPRGARESYLISELIYLIGLEPQGGIEAVHHIGRHRVVRDRSVALGQIGPACNVPGLTQHVPSVLRVHSARSAT
jgi:hypothetical protein